MMDEKKLLDAMSDIDENYIQDAKNFREPLTLLMSLTRALAA